jgi:glycosyltransferase involved in cell wall biosynthesis
MIGHAYYPMDPRIARETNVARAAGYEVDVICLTGQGESARENVDGVDVYRLPVTHRRGVGLVRLAAEYVSFAALASLTVFRLALRSRYDVVQIHAPPDFLAVAGILPRLLGSKVVLDIHDLTSLMYAARFEGKPWSSATRRALTFVERLACSVSDAVVTVHEPYRREIQAHGVAADKITVVMNSPDDRLVEQARTLRGARKTDAGFQIVYHGTITGWYGVPLLIEAVAMLRSTTRDVHLTILGAGDALPEAHAVAERLGLQDRVTFSDRWVPLDQALAHAVTADCGAVPNLSSPLNRLTLSAKLLEYVALEVPVVVARLETLAAHFGEHEVTFFKPGDVASLAAALQWVAEHREEARMKAESARRRAASYGWAENRDRYAALLRRLSSERPRRATD